MSKRKADNHRELVRKAKEIRDREHRLRPNLRLKTGGEIAKFVHKNGLVSVLGGNELPSLISAVLGRPWKPSSKGFTGWLDWWSVKIEGQRLSHVIEELERSDEILGSRIFRQSKTLISDGLWPILDPIVKHHKNLLTRGGILSTVEFKLREIIETEGMVRTDRLRKQARLEGSKNNSRFHRSLTNLEKYGLVVGAEDPKPEKHLHANIWQTWERRTRNKLKGQGIIYEEAVPKLLKATIQASVIVRKDDVREWYPLDRDVQDALELLVSKGGIDRVDGYLISPILQVSRT